MLLGFLVWLWMWGEVRRHERPVTLPQLAAGLPLPRLADGRQAVISNPHASEKRKPSNHAGADFMYRRLDTDTEPVADGEGSRRFVVPDRTPALAVLPGVVRSAGNARSGHYVEIEHGAALRTRYAHLSSLHVRAGDKVLVGAVLGTVGDNPAAKDPRHLHFEVLVRQGRRWRSGNPRRFFAHQLSAKAR